MKWKNRSLHDKVLMSMTGAAVFMFIFCGCLLDSECWWLPLVVMVLSYTWLGLFIVANAERWDITIRHR